jgi:uncharacterized protein (DUF1778 family)
VARPPTAEQVQVNFRMPADLRDRIKAKADATGRSMNSLIVEVLEQKFPKYRVPNREMCNTFLRMDSQSQRLFLDSARDRYPQRLVSFFEALSVAKEMMDKTALGENIPPERLDAIIEEWLTK